MGERSSVWSKSMPVIPDKVSYEELMQILVCEASNLTLVQKFEMLSRFEEAKQARLGREAPDCCGGKEPCFYWL
jgi:hypothetical protein